jgi:hypothetical protein
MIYRSGMNDKKRHHYVPVAYLNGFTGSDGKIFAYRKDEPDRPLHLQPDEIGFENYYYSQPLPDGGQDNNKLEDFFSTIESPWPPIVGRIRQQKDIQQRPSDKDWFSIVTFMMLMRARVPAVRDMVELSLAAGVKSTLKLLDNLGELPPKPEGLEDILDHVVVPIDPHQSLHAIPILTSDFARAIRRLGYKFVHSNSELSFITSDNPVVYFDPTLSESRLLPYAIDQQNGEVELFFPITSKILLYGHTNFEAVGNSLEHVTISSPQELKRFNRYIARFAYRLIFSVDVAHERLVKKYSGESPVANTVNASPLNPNLPPLTQGKPNFRMIFGARPKKPKWPRSS